MKCPLDGNELAKQTYESNIEIDKCPQCGGMWLDDNELERIQDVSERDYSAEIERLPNVVDQAYAMALAGSKPAVNCAGCGQEMERTEHGGCSQILIDNCPKCGGVWLDEGELKALEVFFEKAAAESEEEAENIRTGFFASLKSLFK